MKKKDKRDLKSLSISELEALIQTLPFEDKGVVIQELRVKLYYDSLPKKDSDEIS